MIWCRHKWIYYNGDGNIVDEEEKAEFKECNKCRKTWKKIWNRNQENIEGYYWVSEKEFIKGRKNGDYYGRLETLDEIFNKRFYKELMREDV